MARYLLIQSHDPFTTGGVEGHYEMAANLVKAGNDVTLFLVQNGVLPARPCPASTGLKAAADAGVEVLADEFSLRERGIHADRLATGVQAAKLDVVIDHLADGSKAIWH